MNKFDLFFFQKYLPNGIKIKYIINQHVFTILSRTLIFLFFLVLIPVFLYYISDKIKLLIPFFILEIYLYITFIKIIYDIFDWYNDVWIITNDWLYKLIWSLFKTKTISLKYENIEWIEIVQNNFFDKIYKKWDIQINKMWWEVDVLKQIFHINTVRNILEKAIKEKNNNYEDLEETEDNFETVMQALSWVVEEYLNKNWIKKIDEQAKCEYVEKIKQKSWTIDLTQ